MRLEQVSNYDKRNMSRANKILNLTGSGASWKPDFGRICSSNDTLFQPFILRQFSAEFICHCFKIMLKNQLLYYNFSIDVRNVLENIRRLLISKISTFYIYIYKDYKDYLYVLYIHTYIHNMIYIICNIIYILYNIYIYICIFDANTFYSS